MATAVWICVVVRGSKIGEPVDLPNHAETTAVAMTKMARTDKGRWYWCFGRSNLHWEARCYADPPVGAGTEPDKHPRSARSR